MSHPSLSVFAQEVLFPNHAVDKEYLDEQLNQVTAYWADGDLSKIVGQVERLIGQEIYDLRFTSYYFYGVWVTSKGCSLIDVLESLLHLLEQQSDVWLPSGVSLKKTEAATGSQTGQQLMQTCLGMLFKRIEKRLERFASKEGFEESEPCRIIELCEQLSEVLIKEYDLQSVVGNLTEISRFHQNACHEESLVEEGEEVVSETEMIEAADDTIVKEIAEPKLPGREVAVEKAHSIPMQQLLDKIQMFDDLIQKEAFYKAAIVYEEIQYELGSFNPVRYLPQLFSRFAGINALHSGQLTELVKQNETVQWQALKEYFIADPEGYQQLPIDDESLIAEGIVRRDSEGQSHSHNHSSREFDYD